MNCKNCKTDSVVDDGEIYVCRKCGRVADFPFVNTYCDDETKYFQQNTSVYIRSNHFEETLNEIQGLQTKRIPYSDFLLIKNNFVRRSTIPDNITFMRKILKRLKKNKYLKIVNNLLCQLNVFTPPVISNNTKQLLKWKFEIVEHNFTRLKCNRKNLIPNHFLLYKFFLELKLFDFISFLSFTKNPKLMQHYDQLYKKLI